MRVVFVGSKGMGVAALHEFARQSVVPVGIVSRWDDPSPEQWYGSVTGAARELFPDVPLLQPTDINDPATIEQLRALEPDLMFTAFYPRIYRRELLAVARLGSVNLHFAPLPRYRGSYPGAWAIINGERTHGVTMHLMDPGVDSGDVLGQRMVRITAEDTGRTLYLRCEQAGLELLREQLPALVAGRLEGTPQATDGALYYGRHYPLGGVVNFGWSAVQVVDYVRALRFPPFDSPVTFHRGRPLQVRRATALDPSHGVGTLPGTVLSRDGESLVVATADAPVRITELTDARGRVLPGAELPEVHDVLGR
jgi:methionyl-tRNA formyltransferase